MNADDLDAPKLAGQHARRGGYLAQALLKAQEFFT